MPDFVAYIDVMPHEEILDPQGKAVEKGLLNLGLSAIGNVRVGRHIRMEFEAGSKEKANELVREACLKLLANPIMEGFEVDLKERQPDS